MDTAGDGMKHIAIPIVAFVALVVTSACSCQPTRKADPVTLTILHTNDMHASYLPQEAFWIRAEEKPLIGGFQELAYVVDSIRSANPVSLLMDAGDVMTGSPLSDKPYREADGGLLFEMMNMIGYDVWCPGNHDFDISQRNLMALVRVAEFPTVSANLVNQNGEHHLGNRPYVILERGGLRIGVIGLMTQYLYDEVIQKNLEGIRVLSPEETLQEWVDELDPRTDLLVALTHQGADEDSLLAESVSGLDIIVGGHSHTRLKTPDKVNGVLIVQAGARAQNLGVLEVTVSDDRVIDHKGRLIPLWYHEDRPTTELTSLVDSVRAEIDEEYGEVIGVLRDGWYRRDPDGAMRSFITEAQRKAVAAEVGFMNIYGIRSDVGPGPLTKLELSQVLPFRNVLTTFQLSGSELRSVLLHYLEEETSIIISGVSAQWTKEPGGRVSLLSVRVQGEVLDEERAYICSASDYFVGQAKRYIGVEIQKPTFLDQTLYDAVEDAVREAGVVTSSVPYRIERVTK
jgi:2',3'-cyclic-nucleotide 2'-phosphodiesterase (5'-nucleotidase family)